MFSVACWRLARLEVGLLCLWPVMAVGAWRSLVAHMLGVHEVAGSSPVAPTIFLFEIELS